MLQQRLCWVVQVIESKGMRLHTDYSQMRTFVTFIMDSIFILVRFLPSGQYVVQIANSIANSCCASLLYFTNLHILDILFIERFVNESFLYITAFSSCLMSNGSTSQWALTHIETCSSCRYLCSRLPLIYHHSISFFMLLWFTIICE